MKAQSKSDVCAPKGKMTLPESSTTTGNSAPGIELNIEYSDFPCLLPSGPPCL